MIENMTRNPMCSDDRRARIIRDSLVIARRELDGLMRGTKSVIELEGRLARLPATSQEADTLRRRLIVAKLDLEARDAVNTETIRVLTGMAKRYGVGLG
jgi:hypothetical protein